MRYRSPRSHPANCRLPRRSWAARLGLQHWRVALIAGLLLLAMLGGIGWKLIGQERDRVMRDDTSAISPAYQQMLVLRIATLSDELRFGGQASEVPLRAAIATLDRAHTTLLRKTMGENRQNPDITALYHGGPQSLERAMQGFLNAARRFQVAHDTEAGELAYHRVLALSETTLPLRLNQLTDLIDACAAKQQMHLYRLQLGAGLATIVALLLAGLLGLRLWWQARARAALPTPQSLPTMLMLNGVRHEIGRALPVRAGLRAAARS